ncbi:MAG TPA: hypothetical protein VGX51_05070 [Solirubrobacteraceae bacterium]|nr:hypothetical protein [Solirubrobacteraceae bacterium]
MSPQHAVIQTLTPRADQLCLRLAFEASSIRRATAVAEQLERIVGNPAKIHPLEPLSSDVAASNTSQTFSVELTTPPLPINLAVIQMWERKMLSLEYRCFGSCCFLGWTTQELPELSTRRSRRDAEHASAGGRAQSQRELVENSVLRRPQSSLPPNARGRSEIRAVR